MRSICVIGGGTAGVEAAREASRDGAQVTILERAHEPELPWKAWPDLVRGGGPPPELPSDVAMVRAEAKAVSRSSVLRSDGRSMRFDAIVAATGSEFVPTSVRGGRKPGVHLLNSPGAYSELGRQSSSVQRPFLTGEGRRALQVADTLAGGGRRVRVAISWWLHGAPGSDIFDTLEKAAEARGVSITCEALDRVVGDPRAEAVVIGGRVEPCDSLVIIPKRVPRVVHSDAALGPSGGLLVCPDLRTSSPALFAAGGCAELHGRGQTARVFDEEPRMSGRIAGANSAGRSLMVSATWHSDIQVFGLRWTVLDTCRCFDNVPSESRGTISRKWGPDSACTIVFERRRGRVLRVECLEPEGRSSANATAPGSWGTSLHSLAFADSSDISLVSDTARLGLRLWSNS